MEWPFATLQDARHECDTDGKEDGIWSYHPPSPQWEATLAAMSAGSVGGGADLCMPAPVDGAGLAAVMGALDVHGACVLRGNAATVGSCATLLHSLAAELTATGAVVRGVAQRVAASHELVAHPVQMALCAGALGRQLLRIGTLPELEARMCGWSTARTQAIPTTTQYVRGYN